ncbi:MAG: histidine kinase [Planctomycetota bacterium]|nr:histidine kinase [Planctomycetota bacterium]MDG1985200.1 histidine kinase [Planctomycetota bacterium]
MKARPELQPSHSESGALADLESWLRRPLRMAVLLLVATLIATAATSFGEVELRRAWGGGPEERDLVLRQGVIWLAWALLVPPLSALAGAIARRSRGGVMALACHLPIAAVVASLFLVLENSLTAWVQGPSVTAHFRERVLEQQDPSSTRRRPPWERGERQGPTAEAPGDSGTAGAQASPESSNTEDRKAPAPGSRSERGASGPRSNRERGDGWRGRADWRRRNGGMTASGFVTGDVQLDFQRRWTLRAPRYALIYFALIGLALGARAFLTGRTRDREAAALKLRASRLEAALTSAQLSALKGQLHPHFLFNALHSVGGMIRAAQSTEALSALARIGDLLRTSLDAGPEQFVPLGREVELAERYLAVEQLRLGDRLQIQLEIPPRLAAAEVPALITQPLVENAIKHGIAASKAGGVVRLRAAANEDGTQLLIDVEDDGGGFDEESSEGVGLRHVRTRLAALFEEEASFEIRTMDDGGTRARLRMPLDELEAPPVGGAEPAPRATEDSPQGPSSGEAHR